MYNVTLDRELLLEKLNKLAPYVPKKSITPCFSNFKISIGAGITEILASDGQNQLKVYVEANTKDTFSFCLPAYLFIKTVGLFRENILKISVKDSKITLKSGKATYKITADSFPDDYPVMQLKEIIGEITLQQAYLKKGLKATGSFVNDKGVNPNLIGINVALVDKEAVFTGADSGLLCRYACKPVSVNKWSSLVLPTETANKVCTVLSDRGEINITCSKDKVMLSANTDSIDKIEITSTLAEVNYPNSESLFKTFTEDNFVVDTIEFSDSLKRLKLYGSEVVPSVNIYAENGQEIALATKDEMTGKGGDEVLSVRNDSGTLFNKHYHVDQTLKILKEIEEKDLAFHFHPDPKKPSHILPVVVNPDKEDNFKFLMTAMAAL